jgi:glutamate racemase
MQEVLNKDYGLFILGTKTTIEENFYKKSLINMGYDEKNIVNQLCPSLSKHIEQIHCNRLGMENNVHWLTNRIMEKKPNDFNNFAISLNCTHYYYAVKEFKKCFKELNLYPTFLCPNRSLKNVFTNYLIINKYCFCDVNFYIYDCKLTKNQKLKINYFLKNKNLYFFS